MEKVNKRQIGIIIFKVLLLIIILLSLQAQAGNIQGSRHDLTATWSGENHTEGSNIEYNDYKSTCVYCHAPHDTNSDGPLWNKPLPSSTAYTFYDSNSLDSSTTSISTESLLCLSCHDGTIAVDKVLNKPRNYTEGDYSYRHMSYYENSNSCGNICHSPDSAQPEVLKSFILQDLSDDHPISFTYDSSLATTDGKLKDPSTSSSGLGGTIAEDMLVNDKLECTSCHNVHDPQYEPFLVKSNSGSQLCFTCHIK